MRRRDFITFLSGAAVAWPLGARAQQPSRMRRIGILMPFPKSDVGSQANVRDFRQELARLGWTEGGNVQFDERWSTANMDLVRADAANLVALNPDVIVIVSDRVIPVMTKLTRSIPIVVAVTSDPIASGGGAVESLARPGHNVTGFSLIEFSIFGKMLEILKSLAPGISRVGMIYNPDNPVWAHNDYLNTLADHGVVGFALWAGAGLAMLGLGGLESRRSQRTAAPAAKVFGLARFDGHVREN